MFRFEPIEQFIYISLDGERHCVRCENTWPNPTALINVAIKVKVGNGQEMAQSERNSHSKNQSRKRTKLTLRFFY